MIFHTKKGISKQVTAALFFTIATFICKGINFISLPIFTNLMSTEEMGIVTTYNSWQLLLVVFANLSLDSGSFNIAMMEYKEKRFQYMSSILLLSTIASLIMTGLYFLFRSLAHRFIGLNDVLMILMLTGFVFMPATTFWILYQRYTYRYLSTAIVTVLSSGFSVIFSVILTYFAKIKGFSNLAEIRIISGNLVLILWGAIFYIYIFARGKTGYNKTYWKFVLTVNTPLMVHSLAKHILDVSDKTMISGICGMSQAGIYGVLYSISAMALLIWSAINSSLVPYMFESIEKGMKEKLSGYIEIMLIVYSLACIGLTLVAPEVVKIMATDEYREAVYLMPPIAAGIFFVALYNIYSNVLLYYKKTSIIMMATFIAAIFNLLTNAVFIRLFGYQAAAYTTLVSYIILALLQYLFLLRYTGENKVFNDFHLWCIALFTAIICIVINSLYLYTIVRYSIIGVILVLCTVFYKRILSFIRNILDKSKRSSGD